MFECSYYKEMLSQPSPITTTVAGFLWMVIEVTHSFVNTVVPEKVCVCVCMFVRERERGR